MPSVKITTYKAGESKPEVTISIPSKIFKIAKKLIPKEAYESLEKEGVDLSGIDELISSGESLGVILEVEDHRKDEKNSNIYRVIVENKSRINIDLTNCLTRREEVQGLVGVKSIGALVSLNFDLATSNIVISQITSNLLFFLFILYSINEKAEPSLPSSSLIRIALTAKMVFTSVEYSTSV